MKISNIRPGIQRSYSSVNFLSSCLLNVKPDIYFLIPQGEKHNPEDRKLNSQEIWTGEVYFNF